jgi:pimeloyl-ACP methyl ester carboxylesterase
MPFAANGSARAETMEIAVSAEVVLRVEVYPGDGDAVVVLPGAGLGAASLGDLPARTAADGYRVAAVNPRGAAGSVGPPEGLTLHDLAADVAGVIEALRAGPAHVVGHAGGNRVARCLAADRPELVRTVVLLAAGGLVPPDAEAAEVFRCMRTPGIPEDERRDLRRRALLSPASDPELVDRFVAWPTTGRAFQSAIAATPLDEWWPGGAAPMLVIQGLDDRMAPPGNGRALLADFPERVRLVELPDAGHGLVLEQPEAISRVVGEWLAEHARTG